MAAEHLGAALLAWLATYALHSTLLLALVWIALRRLDPARVLLRERLLKLALVGGFATALLQQGLGGLPLPARFEVRTPVVQDEGLVLEGEPEAVRFLSADEAAPRAGLAPVLLAMAAPTSSGELLAGRDRLEPSPAPLPASSVAGSNDLAPLTPGEAPERAELFAHAVRLAPALWAVLLGTAATSLLLARLRLARHLRGRVELRRGPLVEELRQLRARAGLRRPVRLWAAPHIRSPLCTGWLRPSIFVPERARTQLTRGEQRALLAHELAHVVRRDPLWIQLVWLIEKAFFFQPFNRLARRELHASFELACDAWAVRQTGEPFELARCLARVAGWVVGSEPPATALAMADGDASPRGRSRLALRIERLLAPPRTERTAAPLAAAVGALALLAVLAPGVRARPSAAPAPGPEPVGLEPAPAQPPAASGWMLELSRRLQALGVQAREREVQALAASAQELRAELDGLHAALDELHRAFGGRVTTPRARELLQELEGRLGALDHRLAQMQTVLRREQASILRRDSLSAPPWR